MKKSTILILASSFSGGGAERVAQNLAYSFCELKFKVLMIVVDGSGPAYYDQIPPGMQIISLKCQSHLRALPALFKVLFSHRRCVVISTLRMTNILTGLVSLFLFGKHITIFREANPLNPIYKLPLFRRMLWLLFINIAYSQADLVIANSRDTSQSISNAFILTKAKKKIRVIHNPALVANHLSLATQSCNHRFFEMGNKVMLTVGRLHFQKDHQFLINAFSRVVQRFPSARLIIIGDGPCKDELINQINLLGLDGKVDILPYMANHFPFYIRASLFVMSSRWEGFGNVVVEALAFGLPVVVRDCQGGMSEILKDGRYGCLLPFQKCTPNDFADVCLERLAEFSFCSLEARNRALSFLSLPICQKYLSSINQLYDV
ncbi:glycosyltransferase [Desulfobacterales bacterium]|nr:glycosyltransferase [Desulfobacterales bacterium]